ncbi:MAG: 4Fe-4S dicluster domain-containing protein [Spartobacteria bacterium]|nr:4Fe-4S dicluster domain-containing protein [Spartobacteria bacterium]
MLDFKVNEERCIRCGLCVADCPYMLIELQGDAVPRIPAEKEESCIRCQHCMAICPKGAISIFGHNPDDSLRIKGMYPSSASMDALIRGRRSIRRYRHENVAPALVASLLKTLANAPRGVNYQDLTFRLIDDIEVMEALRARVYAALKQAAAEDRIPESHQFLAQAAPMYEEQGYDLILRTAPHALIVSEPPEAPCPEQDVALTLAYFELLAQSAGLGTVWCGMLKRAMELAPELKETIGLPRDHVYYAMLFGYPAMVYTRTVQRDTAAKIIKVDRSRL